MSTPVGNSARFGAGYTPLSAFIVSSNVPGALLFVPWTIAMKNNSGSRNYFNILLVWNQSDGGGGEVTLEDRPLMLETGETALSLSSFMPNHPAGGYPLYLWGQSTVGGLYFKYSKIGALMVKA